MALVEAENVRKEFRVLAHRRGLAGAMLNLFSGRGRTVTAVDGVSFAIAAGEFVGYIGPNGAGKSTTIKMLTGILMPSAGRVSVCGIEPHRDRKGNAFNIGVVFGQRTQLWWDLPTVEAFDLLGKIYRIDARALRERVAYLTKALELAEYLDTPVRKLSLGQKMRCELAAAMLHEPRVLFLDEPTIGLDVVAKDEVRRLLRRINQEKGTTVLLTSHDLDDIEQLSSRVMVIDGGRIIHDGTPESLRTRFGDFRELVVDLRDEQGALALPEDARVTKREGARVHVEFDASRIRAPELIQAILAAHRIHDIAVRAASIEDTVKRIYSRTKG